MATLASLGAREGALLSFAGEAPERPPALGSIGFNSVLVRMADLRPGFAVGADRASASGTQPDRVGVRMAAVPLELIGETPLEVVSEALRTRFGDGGLDCLILAHPVSLGNDWRANNRDHAARLLEAWRLLEGLVGHGATRTLGIAHGGEAVLDLLRTRASLQPVLNQIEFHPYLNSAALVRRCREQGIAVQALRCLGPPGAGGTEFPVLAHPEVVRLAEAHSRTPGQIVARWCLDRVDGVVLDARETAAVGSLEGASGFEWDSQLDGLDCGYRVDRSPSTLASIHGSTADVPMRVERVPTDQLEVGCHKILYAPVTGSEAFNRRFSFLVWRGLFNLPATVNYARRRRKPSTLAARIRADLDRDGFAVSHVDELGAEQAFGRLVDEAPGLIDQVLRKEQQDTRSNYRYVTKEALADELASLPDLKDAIDGYFGLDTYLDDVSLITIPSRLAGARKQQLWHCDVEDLFTMKVYTFLSDVDDLSGNLEYIAESHPKGEFALEVAELWKYSFVKDPTPEHSHQVPDELLFKYVRPDLLRRLEGPAGTVVLFDARGLHRGGHVLRGIRQVAVSSHTAPNQAHPWRRRRSPWNAAWYPLRWETNVTLKQAPSGTRESTPAAG